MGSMMEFYNSNGETESISLQDMIECDIRSDLENNLHNSDIFTTAHSLMTTMSQPLDSSLNLTLTGMLSSPHHSLTNSLNTIQTVELDGNGEIPNLSWLQNVSLNSVPHVPSVENTNPNLLVDPQTGMPTLQASLMQSPAHQVQYISGQLSVPGSPQSYVQHGQTLQQRLQTVAQHQQQPNRVNYTTATTPVTVSSLSQKSNIREEEKVFPKPVYSYSCLIAMAMKNSETGNLPVSEIYNFMT